MSALSFDDLPLPGLRLVQRACRADARGGFSRLFDAGDLEAAGWRGPVAQVNHSMTSRRGGVRGLHLQRPPHGDMKLVSCIRGEVWDVAVDVRAGSPTFLRWHAEHLSAANGRALLIPEGFAHGFQALEDDVELVYCHSAPYSPADEFALNALDGRLAITWPLPVGERSDRDASAPMLDPAFEGVRA